MKLPRSQGFPRIRSLAATCIEQRYMLNEQGTFQKLPMCVVTVDIYASFVTALRYG